MPLGHSLIFLQNIFHCGGQVQESSLISCISKLKMKWQNLNRENICHKWIFPIEDYISCEIWDLDGSSQNFLQYKIKKKKRSKLKVTWDKWYLELQLAKIWSLGLVYEFNKNFPIGLLSCCFIWLRWQHIAPSQLINALWQLLISCH